MSQFPLTSPAHDETCRIVVDAITDCAIYRLDVDGVVMSWNAGAQKLKGYTAEEVIGQSFSRFFTEEDRRDGLPQRILNASARDGRFQTEGWRVRKDGSRFWAQVIVDPIQSPDGFLIGFAKVTRDASDHKFAEEALREREAQFRLLVERVADCGIFTLDAAGYVASWNRAATRALGYTLDEIIGVHFSQFYAKEDRDSGQPQATLEAAIRDGRVETHAWHVRKDGHRFWAHIVIEPIRRPDGTLTGFAKFTRDITEVRETRQALSETREALLQAQKMEAIGRLSAGVAHDFNNILQSIVSALELVLDDLPIGAPGREFADVALKAAVRGSSLTHHLLSYARKQVLRPETLHLAPFLSEMENLLSRTLGPQIIVMVSPGVTPAVRVDPGQLQTALLNLAINASHAMPQGGTLRIATNVETEQERDWVCIIVTDTGTGMDEATLALAVEPFFTTKGRNGSGLGLPMVQGFVEQSGGRFSITSAPGRGTTVQLRLPASPKPLIPVTSAVSGHAPSSAGNNILVVEDDCDVAATVESVLRSRGFNPRLADRARVALDMLRTGVRVDLVFSDILMPDGMTGFQLADAIRREFPRLPILLATGYAEAFDDAKARGLQVLFKPYRMDDLCARIRQALAGTPPDALPRMPLAALIEGVASRERGSGREIGQIRASRARYARSGA